MNEPPKLLRRAAAAELLDVSERTIRRWGALGRLDERRIGPRSVRVTAASVERIATARARGGQPTPESENV